MTFKHLSYTLNPTQEIIIVENNNEKWRGKLVNTMNTVVGRFEKHLVLSINIVNDCLEIHVSRYI